LDRFISRDDEELSKLKASRRPGRPSSNRQDLLEQKINTEKKEFETGFKVPDLSDKTSVGHLKNWKGDRSGLSIIKFIRITKDMTELPQSQQDHVMHE
jgi:translation machinery-associated protein 16